MQNNDTETSSMQMSGIDLDEDYEGAGFSGKLLFGQRPALLLVDVVRAYVIPEAKLYVRGEVALAANVRLVELARKAGIPIVFTQTVYDRGGRDGGLFYKKVPALECFQMGNSLGDFPDELQPIISDLVVIKKYASAFFGTSLSSSLTAMQIDCLLITGFSTSGCVRASALDALQHGFAPFVVGDACGDRDPAPHEANLFDLKHKYAEVISEEIATQLINNLEHLD